jgi:hypothetical protein
MGHHRYSTLGAAQHRADGRRSVTRVAIRDRSQRFRDQESATKADPDTERLESLP